MEDELFADYTTEDGEDPFIAVPVAPVPTAHMHFVTGFVFGAWYSIVLGSAMSDGVKYLHPETPEAHGIMQSIAWAIGSGIAIALASRLSRSHRLAVGVGVTLFSASVWFGLLYFLRDNSDAAAGDSFFGHALSLQTYLIGFAVLILIVGFVSAFIGASSRNDEELTDYLLLVHSGHWFWLWIPAFAWVSVFPIIAYYFWLQIATALYAIIHPSLWFSVGFDLFFGIWGIVALFKGIEISLKAVTDKSSYGAVVWKRIIMFLIGTFVLASLLSPLLLNLDIGRMKDMPISLGNLHPWWVL
jgi:hypothetical protein